MAKFIIVCILFTLACGLPLNNLQTKTTAKADDCGSISDLIDDLIDENKDLIDECLKEIEDLKEQKDEHVNRLKAVQEFDDSVGGDFCGQEELDDFLNKKKDDWETKQEKIDGNCAALYKEGQDLAAIETANEDRKQGKDLVSLIQAAVDDKDCSEFKEELKDKIDDLIDENDDLLDECEKQVEDLKEKKKEHTEELAALQEFDDSTSGDYCGQEELDDWIQGKKDDWEESQNTLDENCETLKQEGENLEAIKQMVADTDKPVTDAPTAAPEPTDAPTAAPEPTDAPTAAPASLVMKENQKCDTSGKYVPLPAGLTAAECLVNCQTSDHKDSILQGNPGWDEADSACCQIQKNGCHPTHGCLCAMYFGGVSCPPGSEINCHTYGPVVLEANDGFDAVLRDSVCGAGEGAVGSECCPIDRITDGGVECCEEGKVATGSTCGVVPGAPPPPPP